MELEEIFNETEDSAGDSAGADLFTTEEIIDMINWYKEHKELFYTDENGYVRYYDANLVPDNVRKYLDEQVKEYKERQLYGKLFN